jgi:hypothetical protein
LRASAPRAALTSPQWEIYRHGWNEAARFRVAVCGRRFGKSFLLAEELRRAARLAVARSIGCENEIWYGAPNFLQAKRVMWRRLKQSIPPEWLDGTALETSCTLRLKSGHVLRLVGLDKHDSLRGSGLWFFAGDEWADCRPEAWLETIRPMLSVSCGHALFVGTPKGFDHFHQDYLRGQPGGESDYKSFLYSTLDGGNVPEAEIHRAERLLDPRTFRQEYRASFETYSGRVIYAFDRAGNVAPCEWNRRVPIHIGIDFNVNPMTSTIWQEDGVVTRQIDEIVLPTSNTDELCDEIARRYGLPGHDSMTATVSHIQVYPDPAGVQRRTSAHGRTDIGILHQRGFKVVALSSHPLVRDRMNVVNSQFQNAEGQRRAFVDPRCVQSIASYERLSYREGTSEPDKSGGFDHLVDATGYYLFARQASSLKPTRDVHHSLGR